MRISDWSSDVCSSDLFLEVEIELRVVLTCQHDEADHILADFINHIAQRDEGARPLRHAHRLAAIEQIDHLHQLDRKSVVQGKSVSVRVDLGGRRIIKKKKNKLKIKTQTNEKKT